MHDEYWCILAYKGVYTRILVKKRGFKLYRGENRCFLREYRCIWEKTGVFSLMHDEYGGYWCI